MQGFFSFTHLSALRGVVSLFLVAFFIPAASAQGTEGTGPLVFANATLIDGTGTEPRPNVTVVTEDGLISRIVDSKDYETTGCGCPGSCSLWVSWWVSWILAGSFGYKLWVSRIFSVPLMRT